eukprot:scaffold91642_cov45-Attheya_sp.AAC.2
MLVSLLLLFATLPPFPSLPATKTVFPVPNDFSMLSIWTLAMVTASLSSISGNSIIVSALEEFELDAGGLPKRLYTDFDNRLIAGSARKWLTTRHCHVAAAPANRQNQNGLVERNWRTMIQMARAYLTDRQMPRSYWFYAIRHAAQMMNHAPGRLKSQLTTPFELVLNRKPDGRIFFELFSVGYFNFNKQRDGATLRTATQAHTLQ